MKSSSEKPPRNSFLLARCEEWNEAGYQVCYHNGREFTYDEVPNDMFDKHVTEWIELDRLGLN